MSLYTIFLYLHVIGATGSSAGTLVSLVSLSSLRRAESVEAARSLLELVFSLPDWRRARHVSREMNFAK